MNDPAVLFHAYLDQYDQRAWTRAVRSLLVDIHPVDRDATVIWFHFYPLFLARTLRTAADRDAVIRQLWLQGQPDLAALIDASHRFLYGHRYWPHVVTVIGDVAGSDAAPPSLDLAALIRELASRVSRAAGVDVSLTLGITAVGLMTLEQVGADSFASAGAVRIPPASIARSPEQVLKARARDKGQGFFGFLRGRKEYDVTFDEYDPQATFRAIETQEIATAAANDTRDYSARDPRCHEGPIPVQCRSASCGTCWMGVIGGRDRLAPLEPRERQRLREFGYLDSDEPQPLIRLACQAQALGPVSVVLPPYNGIFGKIRRQQEDASPATTP